MGVPDRSSLMAAVFLVVTLLLGIVSGVALDRWVLRPQPEYAGPRRGGPDGGRGRFDPAQIRTQYGSQLARDLDLTPAQRKTVDSLLEAQQRKSRTVMWEVRPRLKEVTESTQAGLRKVLTAEQQAKMERLRKERRLIDERVRRR